MKKGCLILLAVFVGMTFAYRAFLAGTELETQYWLAPVLAILVTLFVANIWGIVFAVRQSLISRRSPREWKNGMMVGISGKLQPLSSPIQAPLSGRSCVIVEYEIWRSAQGQGGAVPEFMGMLMAPCAIHTMRGPVKILGFPVITSIPSYSSELDEDYRRAARYIVNTKFKDKPDNVMTFLNQLNEILNDPDGEVKEDLKNPKFSMLEYDEFDHDLTDDEPATSDLNASADSETDEREGSMQTDGAESLADEEQIYQRLKVGQYHLEEKAFEVGTEVAIFGTFDASKQAINIGGGLKNLMHTIQPGKLNEVIGKNFRRSLIMSIFWFAVCAVSNWYVARLIGVDLIAESQQQLKNMGLL